MHEMLYLAAWKDGFLYSKHYITSEGHNFKTIDQIHLKFSHVSIGAKSNQVLIGEVCSSNTCFAVRRGLTVYWYIVK